MVGKIYKSLDCSASAHMQQHVEDLEDALVTVLLHMQAQYHTDIEVFNLIKTNCAHVENRLTSSATMNEIIHKALRGVKQ